MNTRTPISTISYNSLQALIDTLERLEQNDIIDFWAFVWHQPEDDELKEHAHVYIQPAKQVNTKQLQREFDEIYIGEPLPRKCLPFDNSKFADWYLYSTHNVVYLQSKHQSRKYHYTHSAVITSCQEYLDEKVRTLDTMIVSPYQEVLEAVEAGMDFEKFVAIKQPNINQVNAFRNVFAALQQEALNRAGKPNHEPPSDNPSALLLENQEERGDGYGAGVRPEP